MTIVVVEVDKDIIEPAFYALKEKLVNFIVKNTNIKNSFV